MVKLTEDDILEDVKKISEYLGINCPKIHLTPESHEGLTLEHLTYLGIKDGYKRRLLIHELLHTKGFTHTYPSNFFNANYTNCELSKFVEEQVFGEIQLNENCKHDWSDNGICKKCKAKSMLHNKKMHSMWIPYD